MDVTPSPLPSPTKPVTKSAEWLRDRFLAGLFVVVPIVLTIWILTLIYNIIKGPADSAIRYLIVKKWIPGSDFFLNYTDGSIPGAGFFLTLTLIFLVGLIVKNYVGRRIVRFIDGVMQALPIVRTVYQAIQQAVHALRELGDEEKQAQFKDVVYVNLPGSRAKVIGFMTGGFTDSEGQKQVCVFVPTSPSPLTGFTFLYPREDVVIAKLSVEQASKIIISLGLVTPSSTPSNSYLYTQPIKPVADYR